MTRKAQFNEPKTTLTARSCGEAEAAMKRQTPPKSPKDFLLNELDDALPMGDEEAAEILREAGIDPECELKRAMVLVEEEEKRQQKALFERACGSLPGQSDGGGSWSIDMPTSPVAQRPRSAGQTGSTCRSCDPKCVYERKFQSEDHYQGAYRRGSVTLPP